MGFIGSSGGRVLSLSDSFCRPTSTSLRVTGLPATALVAEVICSYRARPALDPSTYPAATPINNRSILVELLPRGLSAATILPEAPSRCRSGHHAPATRPATRRSRPHHRRSGPDLGTGPG